MNVFYNVFLIHIPVQQFHVQMLPFGWDETAHMLQ